MNELMQANDNHSGKQVQVHSARELYNFLGIEKAFTDWFKGYIESLNLIKDQDYSDFIPSEGINSNINRKRGRPAKDYVLTFNTLLRISTRSNQTGVQMTKAIVNEVVQKREFTIDELLQMQLDSRKQLKESNEALALAVHKVTEVTEQLITTKQELDIAKPKADYADEVLIIKGGITTTIIAKKLNMSATALNEFLHQKGVIYRPGGAKQWTDANGKTHYRYPPWVLTRKYQHLKVMEAGKVKYNDSNGIERTIDEFKWNNEGERLIIDFVKKHHPSFIEPVQGGIQFRGGE